MLDRLNRGRAFLLVLLWISAVCGCAGKAGLAPGASFEKPPVMAQAILENERIVATAHIDVVSARGHYPVRAALILQQPSYLRFELLPVIGTPDLILTATPAEMKIFVPSRGEFYSGKPTARNLALFLPWSMGIEDLVMIFSGACPLLSGSKVSYENNREDQLPNVMMKSTSGESQVVSFTKEGRISKLIRRGTDGREIYQAFFEDYPPDARLAGKITIRMADELTSISVRYSDVQIETAGDRSVFELTAPAGSKIIHMN
jgi:hypothetical protein